MKKYILITIFSLTAGTVFAVLISKFTNWNRLIEQSPDIVIAKCTATFDTDRSKKPTIIIDDVIPSSIEVIKVLKGHTKPGPAHMASQYWPYQGEQFLMFANYRSDQTYTGYTSTESYRIVPLGRYFRTNELAGKTLNEQIQLILSNRLSFINEELKQDNEEKDRIEGIFGNK